MNLLVVRLGALGDIVNTVPAVAAIGASLPGVRIDWLVEQRHRPVLDLFDLDVRTVVIEGGSVGAFLRGMRSLRANRYDVALDFQGLLKSAILARGSGAPRVVGFSRAALREPMAARFYTEDVNPGTARHVIAKNLALPRAVGVESDSIRVPLKRPGGERPTERRVVLNPGAGWPNKQWPPDRFADHAYCRAREQRLAGRRGEVEHGDGEDEPERHATAGEDSRQRVHHAAVPAALSRRVSAAASTSSTVMSSRQRVARWHRRLWWHTHPENRDTVTSETDHGPLRAGSVGP